MSTIVLSPKNASLLDLEVRVEDDEWVNRYTRLEVWRSILGEAGPYEPLSSLYWSSAEVTSQLGDFTNIVGKKLSIRLDESIDVEITFTGVDPLSASSVVAEINTQGNGSLAAVRDIGGLLHVMNTRRTGGLAALRVLPSDGAAILGLPTQAPNDLVFGTDPHIPLSSGVKKYMFTDYWSADSYYYKTRFMNHVTREVSAFSDTIAATQRLGVDPSKVVTGFVKLLQADGRPAAKQAVVLYSAFNGNRLTEGMVAGGPSRFTTDADGYAEFTLLRGISVDIGLDGSGFIRKVTVPTDPAVLKFDMFDPQYGVDDNLSVQRAALPYAERSTL